MWTLHNIIPGLNNDYINEHYIALRLNDEHLWALHNITLGLNNEHLWILHKITSGLNNEYIGEHYITLHRD